MEIAVDPRIFESFPGYVRHVVVAEGLDNAGSAQVPELEALLRAEEARVREAPEFGDLKAHPRLASWREAFQAFGVNPNKCPPSVLNLAKRTRSGSPLPFVSPLVCVFNVVSLRHTIPAGGDDLDKVAGGIRLGYAEGSEAYVPLGQPGMTEAPAPGEIVLLDTGTREVFCRAWCWRNGHGSRIEPGTRRVAINIDALPPVTGDEGRARGGGGRGAGPAVLRGGDTDPAPGRGRS
jgi:DNA/RNA-binding domain of Phe-tRNA-synthetase-like protein